MSFWHIVIVSLLAVALSGCTPKEPAGIAEKTDTPKAAKLNTSEAAELGTSEAATFDTPEACWKAVHDSLQRNDLLAQLNCFAEADRNQILGSLAYQIERLVLFNTPAKEKASELLEHHGIGDLDIMGQLQIAGSRGGGDVDSVYEGVGTRIKNQRAFAKEASQLMATVPRFERVPPSTAPVPSITNVTISGDHAQAQLVESEEGLEVYISFQREDGSWRVKGRHIVQLARTKRWTCGLEMV